MNALNSEISDGVREAEKERAQIGPTNRPWIAQPLLDQSSMPRLQKNARISISGWLEDTNEFCRYRLDSYPVKARHL